MTTRSPQSVLDELGETQREIEEHESALDRLYLHRAGLFQVGREVTPRLTYKAMGERVGVKEEAVASALKKRSDAPPSRTPARSGR